MHATYTRPFAFPPPREKNVRLNMGHPCHPNLDSTIAVSGKLISHNYSISDLFKSTISHIALMQTCLTFPIW